MHTSTILQTLTDRGYRLTSIREALVRFFAETEGPVAVEQLIAYLETRGLTPNKTTVYREIDFLRGQDLLQELDFGDGKKRYEMSFTHHHHLICTECQVIEEVVLEEDSLVREESCFLRERGFEVQKHVLEFFGRCRRCRLRTN